VPIAFTTDGYYIVKVDTGIGEQYASIHIAKPALISVSLNWNPLDSLSAHYKSLEGGPAATPEAAWALWRGSLTSSAFKL